MDAARTLALLADPSLILAAQGLTPDPWQRDLGLAAIARSSSTAPAAPARAAPSRAQQCPYCGTTLTVKNFAPHHRTPLSRGGSHYLGNVVVCRPCNEVQGILTELEFAKLVELLREYPQAIRTDVMARLRFGGRRGR
jgi:hypothetical protein